MVLDEYRQVADVAWSLGVNEGTLGNWVGRERELLNLLTYALVVNSLALHRHGQRSSDPPIPAGA